MGGGGGKSVDTSAQEAELVRQREEVARLETETTANQKTWVPNSKDLRPDGSQKGSGWLGPIPTTDGRVMTEQTAEMDVGNERVQFPLIHPGSTKEELEILARGDKLPRESVLRALEHALERKKKGLSPYKD